MLPLLEIPSEACRYPIVDAALSFPGLGQYECRAMVDTGSGDTWAGPHLATWLVQQQVLRGQLRPRTDLGWDEQVEAWARAWRGRHTGNLVLQVPSEPILLLDADFYILDHEPPGVRLIIGQIDGLYRLRFTQVGDRYLSLASL